MTTTRERQIIDEYITRDDRRVESDRAECHFCWEEFDSEKLHATKDGNRRVMSCDECDPPEEP